MFYNYKSIMLKPDYIHVLLLRAIYLAMKIEINRDIHTVLTVQAHKGLIAYKVENCNVNLLINANSAKRIATVCKHLYMTKVLLQHFSLYFYMMYFMIYIL
jgi:hypothetical protein